MPTSSSKASGTPGKRGRQPDTYANAEERFRGVVTMRVRRALDSLASCEAPSRQWAPADSEKGYHFTADQVEKIVNAIRAQADHLETAYNAALANPGKVQPKAGFTL